MTPGAKGAHIACVARAHDTKWTYAILSCEAVRIENGLKSVSEVIDAQRVRELFIYEARPAKVAQQGLVKLGARK